MFKDTQAFSGFSVNDIPAAKAFYGSTLGVEVSEDGDLLNLHIAGGTRILIYPKPNHVPATYTILNFPVPNLEQAMGDLKQRGIQFEHYNGLTDVDGVFTLPELKQAWFKDPAGNIISIIEVLHS
jgi:catechol 2,3-dioxygenase-like lactoylglutathione lyase family enzyme